MAPPPRVVVAAIAVAGLHCAGRPRPVRTDTATRDEPRCSSLVAARAEHDHGSLRRAETMLAAETYCDAAAAAHLRGMVRLELARYEEAAEALAADDDPARETDRARLRAVLDTRRREPSTAETIEARARDRLAREARTPEVAAERWESVWAAKAPNGRALIRAGLARRASREEARAMRLMERGVAELERETGLPAHAGLRAPPPCAGLFDNHLTVTWLADSRHVEVTCADGAFVVDADSLSRVAQFASGTTLDPGSLPWFRPAATTLPLPEPSVDVPVGWTVLRAGTTAAGTRWFAMTDAATPRSEVVFVGNGNRVKKRMPGTDVRLLDDGRLAVRSDRGIAVLRKDFSTERFLEASWGDLAPDGTRIALAVAEGGDEMFHPRWPRVRSIDLASGKSSGDVPLGDLGDHAVHPATFDWRRVGPLKVDACTPLAILPSATPSCAAPSVRVGVRTYLPTEEVACAPDGPDPHIVRCLDPRGPVTTTNPWAWPLVCRVGLHVLPLGACAHLVEAP